MTRADIEAAVHVLRAGGVVAFPTETVYGLGADALNPAAVERIFAIKGRPAHHPLIVHLADAAQLPHWARDIPKDAHILAGHFWPGPLTLILKRTPQVPDCVTGGQDTVGLRVPGHPVALALLRAFGGGIAAPSANRFGRVSPTTAAHVHAELGNDVDMILDGGPCRVGLESTIVSLVGERPVILRPGAITAGQIEELLEVKIDELSDVETPRAPGMLKMHYAPRTPLRLVLAAQWGQELARQVAQGKHSAVLSTIPENSAVPKATAYFLMPADPEGYAHRLYAALREADHAGCDVILVAEPPPGEDWLAIRDRLTRAAAGSDETGT
ncbi:MAG: L-threonylcarbamoyladenylate synthase [Proteobacteria bacterium]|nr:L-threonylcarbamoyladenylate synthase [Pseudomonadota bacterium]